MNIFDLGLLKPADQSVRPIIDYANLSPLPREGIQAEGNNHYITRGLFIETAIREEDKKVALWTMAEHEVYAYGRWYPSAWMAYIYSIDEYDAARKICGNIRQWEHIKKMFVVRERGHVLENWQTEQAYLQKSTLRQALMTTAITGAPGATSAVKTLLQMIDTPNPVGRPSNKTKQKPSEKEQKDQSVVDDAAARILTFQR